MTQNFQIYLKYADDVEKCDPIMAAACRYYYAQCYLEQTKSRGSHVVSDNTSVHINGILNKIENAHKVSRLNNDQRRDRVIHYCTLMYNKIVHELKTPGSDKVMLLEMLLTMINFIQVLTIYGPLDSTWVKNRNSSFTSIGEDCRIIMEGLKKKIKDEENEVIKPPEQNKVVKLPLDELDEGTTSKPLGTNLKYEEFDASFECTDEDTANKANIDYEDSFDSVYFDEPRPKRPEQDTIPKEEEKNEEKKINPTVEVNEVESHENKMDIKPHKPSNITAFTKSEQPPCLNSMAVVPDAEDINDVNVIPMDLTVPGGNDSLGFTEKYVIKEIPPDNLSLNDLAVPEESKASKVFL